MFSVCCFTALYSQCSLLLLLLTQPGTMPHVQCLLCLVFAVLLLYTYSLCSSLLLTLPGTMFAVLVQYMYSVLFTPADPARHNVCCVSAIHVQCALHSCWPCQAHVCCVSAIHVQSVLFTPADPARQCAPCSVLAVLVQYMHSQCPMCSVCCVRAIHVQCLLC